jgi:hypothetical protein
MLKTMLSCIILSTTLCFVNGDFGSEVGFVLQVHHPLHWAKYIFELEFNSPRW